MFARVLQRCFRISDTMKRGALIVLEGCDRSGKSTQSELLVKGLIKSGYNARCLAFPDRTTEIGKILSRYLQTTTELDDHAVHLLFSANRWELRKTILDDLMNGITLVVDRYAYSGVAFTAAKKKMTLEWCKQPDVGLPKPDVVLYLELSSEGAERRQHYGKERYENPEFQVKVSDIYKQLQDDDWTVVNADQEVEAVHNDLLNLALKALENLEGKPVGSLWTSSSK